MTVLSREDPVESFLKAMPSATNVASVEIVYPVRCCMYDRPRSWPTNRRRVLPDARGGMRW
jgi:hypothetical protein